MRIVQITAVVENREFQSKEDPERTEVVPEVEATVYGLGEDNKLYYWAQLSEDSEELGWKESGK